MHAEVKLMHCILHANIQDSVVANNHRVETNRVAPATEDSVIHDQ